MPEGPSIVILKEAVQQFEGQEIRSVSGNSKTDYHRLLHQKVQAFKSWGKHFLICCEGFTIRIHLLMFGSYRINERKDRPARLSLVFPNGELNFYTCSVKIFEGDLNLYYDWTADVMNPSWDAEAACGKLKAIPLKLVCDALLEQNIFAGVGNIIKNEVLYRIGLHPESVIGKIPDQKIKEMIAEARIYSFQFLEWKKQYVLKQHWLAHTKTFCYRCQQPISRKHTGLKNRRSFFCTGCQVLYA